MKKITPTILLILFVIIFSVIYRIIPWRVPGFAPQIAIILLSGFYIKNKKIALIIPLASLLLSDLLYEILYYYGIVRIWGFYGADQIVNYAFLLVLILFSWYYKTPKVNHFIKSGLLAPTVYFFLSNGFTWLIGGGFARPKSVEGFFTALIDGIPFYFSSLLATLFFIFSYYAIFLIADSKKMVRVD